MQLAIKCLKLHRRHRIRKTWTLTVVIALNLGQAIRRKPGEDTVLEGPTAFLVRSNEWFKALCVQKGPVHRQGKTRSRECLLPSEHDSGRSAWVFDRHGDGISPGAGFAVVVLCI